MSYYDQSEEVAKVMSRVRNVIAEKVISRKKLGIGW